MKKLIFCALTVLVMQDINAQVQWSIFGGPQIISSRYVIRDHKQESSLKYGFQAGIGLKIPFEEKLSFAPQGFYSLKGYKVKLTQPSFPPDTNAVDNNTTIHTVELAPLLQYDFGTGESHFFLRAGPSLDIQLFGHETFNRANEPVVNRKMKFSFSDYGHFGANLLLHFGYESDKGWTFYGQYTCGFGSIINTDNGPRVFHRAAGLCFGYFFHRKSK
jgi:hypothetical protein